MTIMIIFAFPIPI